MASVNKTNRAKKSSMPFVAQFYVGFKYKIWSSDSKQVRRLKRAWAKRVAYANMYGTGRLLAPHTPQFQEFPHG